MESVEGKITVVYDKVILTKEARTTVINMLANCLRPLSEDDRGEVLQSLCDEFDYWPRDPLW